MPALPSWLLAPLRHQFAALLPDRPVYDADAPAGLPPQCIGDRVIFENLMQVLRFGCSYKSISDTTCGATTIRERRNEWIRLGIFAELRDRPDLLRPHRRPRPGGPRRRRLHHESSRRRAVPGRCPVYRPAGYATLCWATGYGIPLGRVLAPANRHDSPLLAPRWTDSARSARCPMTSPSTWTPDTTRRRPATSSDERRHDRPDRR